MSEPAVEATATEAPAATTAVEPAATPKPTETLEFWKQKAREQENRAKSNSEAAKRLQEIEDAQKTAEQKAAEAAARTQQELAEARTDAARYKAAAKFQVPEDYFDLLGSGDEEQIVGRAERLGSLIGLRAENERLTAELETLRQGKPSTQRPTEALRPGATPSETPIADDAYPASWAPRGRPTT
jgi:hypothetical protein